MKRFAFILLSLSLLTGVQAATLDTAALFDCGEQVRIEATPLPGYRFVRWSDGDTSRVRVVDVDGPIDLKAVFDFECNDGYVSVVVINDKMAAVDRNELLSKGVIEETMSEDSVRWYRRGVEKAIGSGFVLQLRESERLEDYYVEISLSEAVRKEQHFCSRIIRGYPVPGTRLYPVPGNLLPTKYFRDGMIYIKRNDRIYTPAGQLVEGLTP